MQKLKLLWTQILLGIILVFGIRLLDKFSNGSLGILSSSCITNKYKGLNIIISGEKKTLELVKERANTLVSLWSACSYFFKAPEAYDEVSRKKAVKENTKEILLALVNALEKADDFDSEPAKGFLEGFFEDWCKKNGAMKMRDIMLPLRLSLVGSLSGVEIGTIMSELGKEKVVSRIHAFVKTC